MDYGTQKASGGLDKEKRSLMKRFQGILCSSLLLLTNLGLPVISSAVDQYRLLYHTGSPDIDRLAAHLGVVPREYQTFTAMEGGIDAVGLAGLVADLWRIPERFPWRLWLLAGNAVTVNCGKWASEVDLFGCAVEDFAWLVGHLPPSWHITSCVVRDAAEQH